MFEPAGSESIIDNYVSEVQPVAPKYLKYFADPGVRVKTLATRASGPFQFKAPVRSYLSERSQPVAFTAEFCSH